MNWIIKKYNPSSIFFSMLILFGFTSCNTTPGDNEILETIYNERFSKQSGFIGVLFDMEITDRNPSMKSYGKIDLYPATVYVYYAQYGLTYGYTHLGPGRYDKFYEKNESVEFLLYKNEKDQWKIESSRILSKAPVVENWKPAEMKNDEFYNERKKFDPSSLKK